MKAKKIAAVLAGTALTATLIIPLAACNNGNGNELGTTTLNVADYATEYNSSYSKAAGQVKQITTINESEIVNTNSSYQPDNIFVLDKGTQGYTVYNLTLNKNILTGLKAVPSFPYLNSIGRVIGYRTPSSDNEGVNEIIYYALDGTELIKYDSTYGNSPSVSITQDYINGVLVYTYKISVSKYDSNGNFIQITNYVKTTTDEDGNLIYETVSNNLYGSEYNKGEYQNGLFNKIYAVSEERPVVGEIADYSYTKINETYTFYHNGVETGSVETTNGNVVGFVGNYMYYSTVTPVSSTATSGYNIDMEGSKGNYTLYKYNIIENTNEALDYNVYITLLSPLYNYTTKSYDAAYILGCKMENGVAYAANEFIYVTDENLNMAYDVSWFTHSFSYVYSVGNDNFIINNYLIDSKLQPINRIDSMDKVYVDEGLIRFSVNSYNGFTDFSGKVVIEPKYNSVNENNITFYGGVAYVSERQSDGTEKYALLKTDGTVTYIEDLEKSSDPKVSKYVNVYNGFYIIATGTFATEDQQGIPESATMEIFNFSGQSLKFINGDYSSTSPMYNFEEINNKYYLTETVTGTNDRTVTYYLVG